MKQWINSDILNILGKLFICFPLQMETWTPLNEEQFLLQSTHMASLCFVLLSSISDASRDPPKGVWPIGTHGPWCLTLGTFVKTIFTRTTTVNTWVRLWYWCHLGVSFWDNKNYMHIAVDNVLYRSRNAISFLMHSCLVKFNKEAKKKTVIASQYDCKGK